MLQSSYGRHYYPPPAQSTVSAEKSKLGAFNSAKVMDIRHNLTWMAKIGESVDDGDASGGGEFLHRPHAYARES